MKDEFEVCAEIYVVVGFKLSSTKSVAYYKSTHIDDCIEQVRFAFDEKGADFVSVRRIKRNDRTKL